MPRACFRAVEALDEAPDLEAASGRHTRCKGRVGHDQKEAKGSEDAAKSGAGGGKQGQRQAESEGS